MRTIILLHFPLGLLRVFLLSLVAAPAGRYMVGCLLAEMMVNRKWLFGLAQDPLWIVALGRARSLRLPRLWLWSLTCKLF